MKRRLLITTGLDQTWKIDKPLTVLGRWCFNRSELQNGRYKNIDGLKIIPYHWDDRKSLYKDYIKIQVLYEEILAGLARSLNNIHNVNHDLRYWRIVLGPWLGYFVQILYDRWLSIESASNSGDKYETTLIKYQYSEIVPNDTPEFNRFLSSDKWNHYIYGKIINEFPGIVTNEIENETKVSRGNKYVSLGLDIKSKLYLFFEKVQSLFVKDSDNFFIATYLPFWQQIKLQISLFQVPIVYISKRSYSNYELNSILRDWELNLESCCVTNEKFEKWIAGFIPKHIPKVFLEGYKGSLAKIEKSHWPNNPKVIWTSNLYNNHEIFKLWSADKVEQGAKLIIGQHGGNYGMAKWNFSEDHQVGISDIYFSWGWKDVNRKKIIPVGQLKSLATVDNTEKYNRTAMLVVMELPRYSYMMMSSVVAGQWLDYQDDQYSFIASLPDYIQENFIVRLKQRKNGWQSNDLWEDKFPNISIDNGGGDFHKAIKNSKIVVSTYNAATYLESISMNIPTVIFWNPEHWELREESQKFMDELEKVGIFHSSPVSAAKHIEMIWNDVEGWWDSPTVQDTRKYFCKQYSHNHEGMLLCVKKVIKKLSSNNCEIDPDKIC